MIIVNQEKDEIINFNNTGIVEIDEYQRPFQINIYVNDVWRGIGQYATQEREKKVLRDIVDNYVACSEYYYMPKE